jgi:cytochrome c oxidase cbb3-type subunit 2
MITPVHFRKFFFVLLAMFGFAWMGLVVFPWMALGHLAPVPQPDGTDILPWDAPGLAHEGEKVYAANGCVYCHTQQVRPSESGADLIRGWGTAKNESGDKPAQITRRTYPRDYIWQGQVFLGNNRTGADLSNVANRFKDAGAFYRYLYDPSVLNPHSSMPAYRFLFTTQRMAGSAPPADAVLLDDRDQPAPGYEVVPTADGQALVAYLLSLKKGYDLPDEHPGPVAMPQTEDSP